MTKDHAGLDERRSEEPDEAVELPPEGGMQHDEDLGKVVEDIENRITEERRAQKVPGNVEDRESQAPVDSGDDAPE